MQLNIKPCSRSEEEKERINSFIVPTDENKILILSNTSVKDLSAEFVINETQHLIVPVKGGQIQKFPLSEGMFKPLLGCQVKVCPQLIVSLEDKFKPNAPLFDPLSIFKNKLPEDVPLNWFSVEEGLPENDLEVDVICEGFFGKKDKLFLNIERHQFTARFNRSKGWNIEMYDKQAMIICWRYIDKETRKILDHSRPTENLQEY